MLRLFVWGRRASKAEIRVAKYEVVGHRRFSFCRGTPTWSGHPPQILTSKSLRWCSWVIISINTTSSKMAVLDLIDYSPQQPQPVPRLANATNVILIDNFDSFSWNIYQYLV